MVGSESNLTSVVGAFAADTVPVEDAALAHPASGTAQGQNVAVATVNISFTRIPHAVAAGRSLRIKVV